MHPRIAESLEYIDAQRADVRAAVELVPSEFRETSPGPDRWSVAQVLHHLALIETRIGILAGKKIATAKAAGVGTETETGSILRSLNTPKIIDRNFRVTAPDDIRPPATVGAEAAWSALDKSREAFRAAVLTGDGLALSEVVHDHPVLGSINLYQWILFVGSHEARHAAQIREIAEQLKTGSTASDLSGSARSQSH